MGLLRKAWKDLSMYVYYPDIEMHSPFRRYSLTIFREKDTLDSVEELMVKWNIEQLAKEEGLIVTFPNPPEGGFQSAGEAQIETLFEMLGEAANPLGKEMQFNEQGIPMFESMMERWHLMNDTKYFVGIKEGATLVYKIALQYPNRVTAIAGIGGTVDESILKEAVKAPMPAYLREAPDAMEMYLLTEANGATAKKQSGGCEIFYDRVNPLQMVCIDQKEQEENLLEEIYHKVFSKVRRTNTGAHGDIETRMRFLPDTFDYYIKDRRLGDQGGIEHTWFVHCPKRIKEEDKKVPMMIFMHGGSDNPAEAAEMSKFHELGEKKGFITVYPWGSNSASWNCNLFEEEPDDIAYLKALIEWMITQYPVDATRVYLSGFSNGAGEAQVFAMAHPEMVAAICHIDSNWPGQRIGSCELTIDEVPAFALGMEQKKKYDYKMPVWYTYGTREPSYPIYRGCSQQHQYDYWKQYNHIEIKETPVTGQTGELGCGVLGDTTENLTPSERHPHHTYEVQRFCNAEGENLYNYVMMHDKGHEVAQMDPSLGWDYVEQFRRNADGSLSIVREEE